MRIFDISTAVIQVALLRKLHSVFWVCPTVRRMFRDPEPARGPFGLPPAEHLLDLGEAAAPEREATRRHLHGEDRIVYYWADLLFVSRAVASSYLCWETASGALGRSGRLGFSILPRQAQHSPDSRGLHRDGYRIFWRCSDGVSHMHCELLNGMSSAPVSHLAAGPVGAWMASRLIGCPPDRRQQISAWAGCCPQPRTQVTCRHGDPLELRR